MNKTTYQSPELDVIDICAEKVLCDSGQDLSVSDPWSDNVELIW